MVSNFCGLSRVMEAGMIRRPFGSTGLSTSLLGFGGFHLLEIPAAEAEWLLNAYLDAGGNYVETAAGYGDGESELKIGRAISGRREEYILATKSAARDKAGFLDSLDRSLRNLRTDRVELMILHAVGTRAELDAILGPGGAMEGALEAKRQGKLRFVGISMHGQPDVLIDAMRRAPFDAVMTTVNYYDRFNFPEIEDTLLPLAKEKGAAAILMKPIADGLLWRSAPEAFRYAMSRPVSVVVTGINTREMLRDDLSYAERFVPMTEAEEEALFSGSVELSDYVCRQCGRCLPCPQGVPITDIFRLEGYFDRQMRDGRVKDPADFALRDRLRFWFGNRDMAMERYGQLEVKAEHCSHCGQCSPQCPYGIDIERKLELCDYKLADKRIY